MPDTAIMEAVAQLVKLEKLVVEPSEAASLAAVRAGKDRGLGAQCVRTLGGNITAERLRAL